MPKKSERAVQLSRLESQQEQACSSLAEVADKLASLAFDAETKNGGWHTLSSAVRVNGWRQQLYDALSVLGYRDDRIGPELLAKCIAALKAVDQQLASRLQFSPGGRCRVCNRVPASQDEVHECWDGNFLVRYQAEPDPIEVLKTALEGKVESATIATVLGALAEQPRDAWERAVHLVWESRRPTPELPKR